MKVKYCNEVKGEAEELGLKLKENLADEQFLTLI